MTWWNYCGLTSMGNLTARSVANYQPTENLIIQVWGTDGRIQFARPTGIGTSMDSATRVHGITAIKTVTVGGQNLRVLTVPLSTTRGAAGTLQIAITLTILDEVQRTLSVILIVLTSIAMVIFHYRNFPFHPASFETTGYDDKDCHPNYPGG